MSFDQLAQHAEEIRAKAVREQLRLECDSYERDLERDSNYPFWGDSPYDIDRKVRQYRSDLTPKVESMFADVPQLFAPFETCPDPAAFDTPINALERTMAKLSTGQASNDPASATTYPANPELDKLSGSESYLEDWTGDAAREFKENFIDPFPSIVHNQYALALVSRHALEAEKSVWIAARHDIDEIAHGANKALDHMYDCGGNSWAVGFAIFSAVVAVASIPLTAGSSSMALGLSLGIISGAAGVASAGPPPEPEKTSFSGNSPTQVINALRDAIGKLKQGIADQERAIADTMNRNHNTLVVNRASFLSPRPALADAAPGTYTGPGGLGYAH